MTGRILSELRDVFPDVDGVSKGSGLFGGLGDLGISHHNTIAIGDAENDHSLLEACGSAWRWPTQWTPSRPTPTSFRTAQTAKVLRRSYEDRYGISAAAADRSSIRNSVTPCIVQLTVRHIRFLACALAALCIFACSDRADTPASPESSSSTPAVSTSPPSVPDLAGRQFRIARITENGTDQPIVAGTQPTITFTPTEMHIDTGCNGISATYALQSEELVVTNAETTLIGCPTPLAAQEAAISRATTGTATVKPHRRGPRSQPTGPR